MRWNKQVSIVFWVSLIICSVFIVWGAVFPNNVDHVLGVIDVALSTNFGWFYLLATTLFVLFAIFLVFGPYSKIRLVRMMRNQSMDSLLGLRFYSLQGWA